MKVLSSSTDPHSVFILKNMNPDRVSITNDRLPCLITGGGFIVTGLGAALNLGSMSMLNSFWPITLCLGSVLAGLVIVRFQSGVEFDKERQAIRFWKGLSSQSFREEYALQDFDRVQVKSRSVVAGTSENRRRFTTYDVILKGPKREGLLVFTDSNQQTSRETARQIASFLEVRLDGIPRKDS